MAQDTAFGIPITRSKPKLVPLTVTEYYAAIRHSDDGHDWMDTDTIAWSPDQARKNADRCNSTISQWANANRVVRIAKIEIREVD